MSQQRVPPERWFRRRHRSGRIGVVGVSRLLVFQIIQVGLFVVLVQGLWAAILGGVVGALAIVVVFGRWRGRWLTDALMLWVRLRRRSGVVGRQLADPRLVAIGELVPDLVVEDLTTGPENTRWGMGSDGAGWFAVLEVEPSIEPGVLGVDPPVPLAALTRIAAEAGLAGVVVQVVSYSAPPVAAPQPAGERLRRLWVAVRLDAEAVAQASAGAVDDPEQQVDVPVVLAELTRRVRRALKRRGLGSRLLDAEGVVDALAFSCDVAAAAGPGRVHEQWQEWHSPRLAHRCFWLHTWPDPDRATTLLATLADLPEARVSIALLLEPGTGSDAAGADLRCLVRLAASPESIERVGEFAIVLAERQGGRLFPLDGEQALAVYATAPSGGGAR